jgi:chromosome segregation protein
MYLKSLELNGFKSFAKKTELEFKTPITSIVGPNGSGKSNAAEAFRFVLGEQSLKSMRGKKGEDMIWNGSDQAPRANRASVKIVFDNSRRFLNMDFDEVSVERTVFRDGVNEYSINGTKVRLKDVLELLASANIGASGHHIISQGEADRILNSSAKDRKAMIEDALGLKIYQYKLTESERKLVKTEENIKSVEALRREVIPHLKFLKKQVEKMEKALEMKAELGVLYKQYLKRENLYLSAAREKLAAEKAPIEKRLAELERDLKEAKAILEGSGRQDQKSAHIIELEEKIRTARNTKDELVRQIGRTEGLISAEERVLKRQKEMAEKTEITVSITDIENLAGRVSEQLNLAEKEAVFESSPGSLKKILANIRSLISDFVAGRKRPNENVLAVDSEKILESLRVEKTELDTKIADIRTAEENLSKEYAELRKEIDEEKDTNRAAEKKVFEVMTAQNEIISERNIIRAREEALRLEEEDYKREMGEAAAIIGREVLDFKDAVLDGGQEGQVGQQAGNEAPEDRHAQHERRRQLEKIKIRLEESDISTSDDVVKEFREVSERENFLIGEIADLEKSAEMLKGLINEFSEKISTEFSTGLEKINTQFQEFFSLMFGGGEAKLVLLKEKKRKVIDTNLEEALSGDQITEDMIAAEEETDEGIEISVNLPRKKIKSLMMLSGGERALTSIALIFAMSQVKPPPFIILDETDAALDESNSKKYGDMIENLAKYSQLILITHNRETMSRAGVLYGVTMLSGVSKLLSIQFDEAVAVAK